MTNFSQTLISSFNSGQKYNGTFNDIHDPNNSSTSLDQGLENEKLIFAIFIMFFCILGMVGNAIVIHLLASCKRNTFTVYILNLAIADFGLVTIELTIEIHWLVSHLYSGFPYVLFQTVFLQMYSTGQFILIVISIDRCISVLFPIWYRCHRPAHWYTTVSAITWVIFFILGAIHFTVVVQTGFGKLSMKYQFIVNAVVCLPLMTISSLILFIKVYFISRQQRQGKLLLAILLTLFFFLILAFPLNAIYFIRYVVYDIPPKYAHYGYLCACINSSINPLIYFMVGKTKMGAAKTMKEILQKVFKEEEDPPEEKETSEC